MIRCILLAADSVPDAPPPQFGWMGLIIPVAVAAIGAIVRAFTAQARITKDCGDDVAQVRDSLLTESIRPTLAAVIVAVQPYVDFGKKRYLPGEAGDPEIEARRVLGSNPLLYDLYAVLEDHYSVVHEARLTPVRRVAHARRIGVAAATFLVGWIYFAVWLCFPGLSLPLPITIASVVAMSGALGWIGAEALSSARESNSLSVSVQSARMTSGSTR